MRKLQEGDINIYMKKSIKALPSSMIPDSGKRMKLGVEIWVKKEDSEKAARDLQRAANNALFASELRTKCPSVALANEKVTICRQIHFQIYIFIYA